MSSRRFDTGELMRYTVKRNEVSTVLYGKFANAWENWNETGGDPAERIGWKILSEEAMLYGNTDSALYDKFRTGAFELVAGRHIAPEDRKRF